MSLQIRHLALIAATVWGAAQGAGAMACETHEAAAGAPAAQVASAATGAKVKGMLREWGGTYSGVTERSQRVVRTQAEWEKLWAQVHANEVPPAAAPKIDWSREMVLAVFMGERSTGGYRVAIRGVKTGEKEIVVEVEETAPPPDAITVQSLTQPYHLVVVKRSDLPVRFVPAGKATAQPAAG
jgi:PrcB C-terminal